MTVGEIFQSPFCRKRLNLLRDFGMIEQNGGVLREIGSYLACRVAHSRAVRGVRSSAADAGNHPLVKNHRRGARFHGDRCRYNDRNGGREYDDYAHYGADRIDGCHNARHIRNTVTKKDNDYDPHVYDRHDHGGDDKTDDRHDHGQHRLASVGGG